MEAIVVNAQVWKTCQVGSIPTHSTNIMPHTLTAEGMALNHLVHVRIVVGQQYGDYSVNGQARQVVILKDWVRISIITQI